MTEKEIKHKGFILSDKEVIQRLNEQYERIKELEKENQKLRDELKKGDDVND